MLGLQPDKSVEKKVVGRDYTGKAANMAVADAYQERLLTKFSVK